ncbi:malonate transporter subunit MadL [Priestia aryabhattai]|uniref:malonate transporter subunit MadL n=1 Tax=Priestia aryabhattai TaxID=412384 RepID=UPI0035BE9546
MIIFGVALLSICMLIGVIVGDALGGLMGVEANVGGVGVSMLLLVLAVDYLKKKNKLQVKSEEGIAFWGGIYIPIVVAMSAQQNVVAALDGGGMAILAGVVGSSHSRLFIHTIYQQNRRESEGERTRDRAFYFT